MTGALVAELAALAAGRLRAEDATGALEALEHVIADPGTDGRTLGRIAAVLRLWRGYGDDAAIRALERLAREVER